MPKTVPLFAIFIVAFGWATPSLSQDADAGEKVFKKCKACHQVGADAANRVGPALNGVVGRTAGTYDGFKYSQAMTAAGEKGLVWTDVLLAEYIEDPTKFLRTYLDDGKAKSAMSFKLKDERRPHGCHRLYRGRVLRRGHRCCACRTGAGRANDE